MKKIILLALTALMTVGCGHELRGNSSISKEKFTYVIDSCEYIKGVNEYAHKGNCKFCAERRQKELEELVIKLKEK